MDKIFEVWLLFSIFGIHISFSIDRALDFYPPNKSIFNDMCVLGLFGVMVYQLLFMHGMKWTAAGDASVIMPINPIFTALTGSSIVRVKK